MLSDSCYSIYVLLCFRLILDYSPPEYAQVLLASKGMTGQVAYPLAPAVEVFVAGVLLGQLVRVDLRPAGSDDDTYLHLLAGGQLTMQASSPPFCVHWQVCPASHLHVTALCIICLACAQLLSVHVVTPVLLQLVHETE